MNEGYMSKVWDTKSYSVPWLITWMITTHRICFLVSSAPIRGTKRSRIHFIHILALPPSLLPPTDISKTFKQVVSSFIRTTLRSQRSSCFLIRWTMSLSPYISLCSSFHRLRYSRLQIPKIYRSSFHSKTPTAGTSNVVIIQASASFGSTEMISAF